MQAGSPMAITGGVGEALIATVTGLAVATFALLGHSYFGYRLDGMVTRLLAGLARPDSGHICVFGEEAARRSVKFRRLIGLVPQENTFESELTIEQSMLCTAKLYGIADARARICFQVFCFR